MTKNTTDLFGPHHGLDEKSVKFLLKAIDKNNLPGFDYIEFKRSLTAMADMEIDEATAYRSAFATAGTMGLTKEKLLKTAQHYKSVLASEKEQFEAAVEKQLAQRVKSKRAEVEKLRKKVEEYQAKIAELEGRISSANEVINGAEEEVRSAEEKIKATQDNFERTLQSILNQIDQDLEQIEKYL